MSSLTPAAMSAVAAALGQPKDQPKADTTPAYDEAAARKENGDKLPIERPEYLDLQKQFGQPVLKRRQVRNDKDKVLAEAVLISGGGFAPDMGIAHNDKGIRILNKDGELTAEGRDGLKFVDIDINNPKKITERKTLFDKEELAKLPGLPLLTDLKAKVKLEGLIFHSAKGAEVVVAKDAVGYRIEGDKGSMNLTVDLKGAKALPNIGLLDSDADYKITVKNIMEKNGEKTNVLDVLKVDTVRGTLSAIQDQAGVLKLGIINANSANLTLKYDNRKAATLNLMKDGKRSDAFKDKDGDKNLQGLAENLGKALKAAQEGEFEKKQLPPMPKDKEKER